MSPYAKKVILNCSTGSQRGLISLVEDFILQKVMFVAVIGKDCVRIEDMIDEIVVGEGVNDRFILTSSHPNETLDQVVAFAKSLTGDYEGDDVQVVELN